MVADIENSEDGKCKENHKTLRWNALVNSTTKLNQLFCCAKVGNSVLFYVILILLLLLFVYVIRKLVSLPSGSSKYSTRKSNNKVNVVSDTVTHSPAKWPVIDHKNVTYLDNNLHDVVNRHDLVTQTPLHETTSSFQPSPSDAPYEPTWRPTNQPKQEDNNIFLEPFTTTIAPTDAGAAIVDSSDQFDDSWYSGDSLKSETPTSHYMKDGNERIEKFDNTWSAWNEPEYGQRSWAYSDFGNPQSTPSTWRTSYSARTTPSATVINNNYKNPTNVENYNADPGDYNLPWTSTFNSGWPTDKGSGWSSSLYHSSVTQSPSSYSGSWDNQPNVGDAKDKWSFFSHNPNSEYNNNKYSNAPDSRSSGRESNLNWGERKGESSTKLRHSEFVDNLESWTAIDDKPVKHKFVHKWPSLVEKTTSRGQKSKANYAMKKRARSKNKKKSTIRRVQGTSHTKSHSMKRNKQPLSFVKPNHQLPLSYESNHAMKNRARSRNQKKSTIPRVETKQGISHRRSHSQKRNKQPLSFVKPNHELRLSYESYQNLKERGVNHAMLGKWNRKLHRVKTCKKLSFFTADGKVVLNSRNTGKKHRYSLLTCTSPGKENKKYGKSKRQAERGGMICRESWFITTGKIVLQRNKRRHNGYSLHLCNPKYTLKGDADDNNVQINKKNGDDDDKSNLKDPDSDQNTKNIYGVQNKKGSTVNNDVGNNDETDEDLQHISAGRRKNGRQGDEDHKDRDDDLDNDFDDEKDNGDKTEDDGEMREDDDRRTDNDDDSDRHSEYNSIDRPNKSKDVAGDVKGENDFDGEDDSDIQSQISNPDSNNKSEKPKVVVSKQKNDHDDDLDLKDDDELNEKDDDDFDDEFDDVDRDNDKQTEKEIIDKQSKSRDVGNLKNKNHEIKDKKDDDDDDNDDNADRKLKTDGPGEPSNLKHTDNDLMYRDDPDENELDDDVDNDGIDHDNGDDIKDNNGHANDNERDDAVNGSNNDDSDLMDKNDLLDDNDDSDNDDDDVIDIGDIDNDDIDDYSSPDDNDDLDGSGEQWSKNVGQRKTERQNKHRKSQRTDKKISFQDRDRPVKSEDRTLNDIVKELLKYKKSNSHMKETIATFIHRKPKVKDVRLRDKNDRAKTAKAKDADNRRTTQNRHELTGLKNQPTAISERKVLALPSKKPSELDLRKLLTALFPSDLKQSLMGQTTPSPTVFSTPLPPTTTPIRPSFAAGKTRVESRPNRVSTKLEKVSNLLSAFGMNATGRFATQEEKDLHPSYSNSAASTKSAPLSTDQAATPFRVVGVPATQQGTYTNTGTGTTESLRSYVPTPEMRQPTSFVAKRPLPIRATHFQDSKIGPNAGTGNEYSGYSRYITNNVDLDPYSSQAMNILCFGDSLTSGYYNHGKGKHPYSIKLGQILNSGGQHRFNIVTRGVVGEMVHGGMTKRLPKLFNTGTHFDWVIVLGGTNDVSHVKNFGDDDDFTQQLINVWSPKIVKDIEKLHKMSHDHGARTVLVTIPETAYEFWPKFKALRRMRLSVNAALRLYAEQVQDSTVLCDMAIKLPRSTLPKRLQKLYWNDHIHLNPVGYNKMAEIIVDCIKPYITK